MLSYHSAQVYDNDVCALEPSAWLNDNVVAFAFERLQHAAHTHAAVRFVNPGVAFLCMHESDAEDLAATVAGCELNSDAVELLLLLPVSDKRAGGWCDTPGGSHWSLLAYVCKTRRWFHFDSMAGSGNGECARKLAAQLAPLLGSPASEQQEAASSSENKSASVAVVSAACPQQRNGSDCGVYAIAVAAELARRFAAAGDGDGDVIAAAAADGDGSLAAAVTPAAVGSIRLELHTTLTAMFAAKK
jgi:hypothetical protein